MVRTGTMWNKMKSMSSKLPPFIPTESLFLKFPILKTDYYENEIKWLLRILNISGNCPLTSLPALQGNLKRNYDFKWRSIPTIVSGSGALIAHLSWLVFVVQILMKKDWLPEWAWLPRNDLLSRIIIHDPNLSKSVKKGTLIALVAVFGMLPIFQFLDIGATWKEVGRLKTFLNNWCYFESDYRSVFFGKKCPLVTKIVAKPFRKLTTFLIYAYIWVPALTGGFLTYFAQNQHASLQFLLIFYLSFRLNSVEMAVDALNVLGFKMVADAFFKIRQGIELELKLSNPTKEKVVKWRRLIQTTREQCHLLMKYQRFIQLHFIGRCFCIVTLFLFIALNVPTREDEVYIVQFHITWGIFGCLQICRMFLKTMEAEFITREEEKIAKIFASIDTTELDDATITQLKFGHDTITQNPCVIKFGNLVFNNGLVLKILGHVATYLIVLMQFVQN